MNHSVTAVMAGAFAAMVGATVALSGCTRKTAAEDETKPDNGKMLVLYYSQTGSTRKVAEELQRQLDADIAEIVAVDAYPADYASTIARWQQEKEQGVLPDIEPLEVSLSEYSTIFLGFPVWGGSYALPVASFVEQYADSLKGKRIVTFATFGSGGLDSSTANLTERLPESEVAQGYGVRNIRVEKAADELNRFLIEGGYKAGKIEPLPEFSSPQPVTSKEQDIFDEACGDYQFPLGIPTSFSERTVPGGTEYRFKADAQLFDGSPAEFTIYVIAEKGDKDAEFTVVIR